MRGLRILGLACGEYELDALDREGVERLIDLLQQALSEWPEPEESPRGDTAPEHPAARDLRELGTVAFDVDLMMRVIYLDGSVLRLHAWFALVPDAYKAAVEEETNRVCAQHVGLPIAKYKPGEMLPPGYVTDREIIQRISEACRARVMRDREERPLINVGVRVRKVDEPPVWDSDLRPIEEDEGALILLSEFAEDVRTGGFMNDDGSGYWATATEVSENRPVDLSDLTPPHPRFTHVLWYNK